MFALEVSCEITERAGILSRFPYRVEVLHPVGLAAETAQKLGS